MNIEHFYKLDGATLSFTRAQASDFAKKVAGDFNPIHDVDSKRFCVPGDLLFSVIIHHFGLHQKMVFNFSGMVGDGVDLLLPPKDTEQLEIKDEKGKKYLTVDCSGDVNDNATLIESLSTRYVEFSSQAFPHILVPLMSEQNVMINTERPLIIYESMSFELDTLAIDQIELELSSSILEVNGKRGNVTLDYILLSHGQKVGQGCKRMVLSGLREFEKTQMDDLIEAYSQRRMSFKYLS